jgi:hypothetical protein
MARPDKLSALEPNGSGRGPANPYNAVASKATQTANTAHNGNQITVSRSTMSCRAEPVETAARRRSNGVANRRSSTKAKAARRNMLACGTPGSRGPHPSLVLDHCLACLSLFLQPSPNGFQELFSLLITWNRLGFQNGPCSFRGQFCKGGWLVRLASLVGNIWTGLTCSHSGDLLHALFNSVHPTESPSNSECLHVATGRGRIKSRRDYSAEKLLRIRTPV